MTWFAGYLQVAIMFNIKTTTLIKIGITVHSKVAFYFAIFPRNTEILVFLGLSESCVYLVPFNVAVFPNLAVLYHQYSNYMPF